jgi:hypothetical protein
VSTVLVVSSLCVLVLSVCVCRCLVGTAGWETSVAEVTQVPAHVLKAFRRVAVLRALRPDRVTAAASSFVQSVFGESFLALPDATLEALVQVRHSRLKEAFYCRRR